ncbi:MAG: putative rane protein [Parachlamydiales bacterium]|nr:putative rane protein [Parachlamydiales bacterium]
MMQSHNESVGMSMFVDRRALIQFCVLLFAAIICMVGAKIVAESLVTLAIFLFVLGVVLAWVAIVREVNAAALHMPGPVRRFIHWIHAQTLEIVALVMLVFLRLATLWRKNQAALPQVQSRPILLVHGYLNAGFVWDFHKNQLIKNGFGPIYTINLGHPFRSIRTYAQKVKEKVDQIARETGQSEITLIGHSMGGLVSYYYAAKLARAYTVPQVITIASPLQGTRVARIGLGRCAREMQIDSELLQDLKSAVECCTDVKFYNIATKTDQLIVPYTSSFFNSSPAHQFLIDDIGHASLLFSERVSNQICRWLKDA